MGAHPADLRLKASRMRSGPESRFWDSASTALGRGGCVARMGRGDAEEHCGVLSQVISLPCLSRVLCWGVTSGLPLSTSAKKERHFYFIISYTSNSGEDQFIQLEDTRLYRGVKVANKLKELCGVTTVNNSIQL